jgi:hypothetical protein
MVIKIRICDKQDAKGGNGELSGSFFAQVKKLMAYILV